MTQPGDRYRVGVEIGGTFADLICPGRPRTAIRGRWERHDRTCVSSCPTPCSQACEGDAGRCRARGEDVATTMARIFAESPTSNACPSRCMSAGNKMA